ncbi:hypothetical protein Hokovirus_1_85 [Hokovirus HKV1]|uniref:Uncharacterized protein n=1 Tax=Hokovirus HKV1 TaxID=1977638 RepID=A0A1V0SER4_9VIRU|nr:hypothetical protein Hokovirus_1_85 [Hokovirus HKV1]
MIRFCNTKKQHKNILNRAYYKFRINENVLILSNINLDNFFRVNYSNGKSKISLCVDNMVLDNSEIKLIFSLILLLEKDIIDKNTDDKYLIQKIDNDIYTINKFKNHDFIKMIQINVSQGEINDANLIIKTKTKEYEISVLKQVNNMYQHIELIDNNECEASKIRRNKKNYRNNYDYDDHYSNYYYNYSNNYSSNNYSYNRNYYGNNHTSFNHVNNYMNNNYNEEIDYDLYNFSCA